MEFELPSGYALDNAEKPTPFAARDISQYKIDLGVTIDQHTLIMHRQFYFGGNYNVLFPQAGYSQLKTYFDQLHKNDEHTITLKLAASN